MSQTYAAQMDVEHCGLHFEHELLTALRGRELAPEIEELWSVGTIYNGEDNTSYPLAIVSHHTAPLDEIDVATAERTETAICSCPQYFFECFDRQVGAPIDECKHVERVNQRRRTDTPDEQQTLLEQ